MTIYFLRRYTLTNISGIVKAIQTEGNGKEYVNILEDYNANMIVALRESLHTIVNDVVASIKMTNPDQAVKKSDFLVKHIFDGLFKQLFGKHKNIIVYTA